MTPSIKVLSTKISFTIVLYSDITKIRKRSEKNSEKKSVGKKSKGKIILKTILGIIITGILIGLFLLYGPIKPKFMLKTEIRKHKKYLSHQ